MKFDLDCVRDILLAIESMEYGKEIKIAELAKAKIWLSFTSYDW